MPLNTRMRSVSALTVTVSRQSEAALWHSSEKLFLRDRFLVDEMFSMTVAELLRETYGHDAVHVAEVGLRAADDSQVAARARAEDRAVVTENVADFAGERDLVLVFVLKRNLPAGGGQSAALARILDGWVQDHPDPYLGPHWPRVD